MNSLYRLLRFVAPYRKTILWGMIMLVAGVVMDLAIPRLMQHIIDEGIAKKDLHVVLVTAGIMMASALLAAALGIGNATSAVAVSQRFAADLREETFQGNTQRRSGRGLTRSTALITESRVRLGCD